MKSRNRSVDSLLIFVLIVGLCAGLVAPSMVNSAVKAAPVSLASPGDVVISEVAWSGTTASVDDEWIELYNTTLAPIDLTGWRLIAGDGNPDITFTTVTCIGITGCMIPAGGFFLLERGYDNTVQPEAADLIFFGQLEDSGESLYLKDNGAVIIDTANLDGGAWPAGSAVNHASMERVKESGVISADVDGGWVTFDDTVFIATDAAGNDVYGTPGQTNWAFTVTPTFTPTPTPSDTPTFTPSSTSTSTFTPTRTQTNTPGFPMTVIINEVAWGGTRANVNDEWIELYNPGVTAISLSGWILKVNSTPVSFSLTAVIPAGGYFILARNPLTFSSGVTLPSVDDTLTTSLPNSNASLQLFDSSNTLIDSANRNGGAWPAGGSSGNYPTMERKKGFGDSDSAWFTNGGVTRNGADSAGFSIYGTPKKLSSPTATPTRTRTPTRTPTNKPLPTPTQSARVVINEFLPHPGFDWNQDGRNNVGDEFIEIINFGPAARTLTGWKLDDVKNSGSDPFTIPTVTLKPGERILFYGSQTNILLSDGGDSVRLLDQRGIEMDSYNYPFAAQEDVSWCRIPDGLYVWYTDCVPTPNNQNKRGAQIPVEAPGTGLEETRCKDFPDTTPSDLLTAECNGFGSKFWNHMFWDGPGEEGDQPVWNGSKWGSFIQ